MQLIPQLLSLILSDKGIKSGFHWLRATISCLGKPRRVLHFTFAPWSTSTSPTLIIIVIIIIIIIIIIKKEETR